MLNKFSILFFCLSDSFGGLEMQMVNKSREAMDSGYLVLLVIIKNSPMDDYAQKLNVPCKYFKMWFDYIDVFNSYKLGAIFEEFRANICIVGLSRHISAALLARKLKSQDTAVIFMQQMQSGLNKVDFFHNYIYRNIDSIIVPADFMKKQLLETTVIDPEKINVIRYGIDTDKFNPKNFNKNVSKSRFGLNLDKLIFGMPARFDEIKDQLTLVRAFHKAKIKNSILLLAGDGHINYKMRVKKEIDSLGIGEKVLIIDFTLDFAELLNAIDVYILPSQTETFSLALIQAMAAGLPIIATNEGGTPEAIHHLKNGLLFKARDVDELSDLLVQISNDRELRERLATQALYDANLIYNIDIQNEKFFKVCKNSFEKRIWLVV